MFIQDTTNRVKSNGTLRLTSYKTRVESQRCKNGGIITIGYQNKGKNITFPMNGVMCSISNI